PGTQVENLAGTGPPERPGQERRDRVEGPGPLHKEPAVIADPLANAGRAPGQVGDLDQVYSSHVNPRGRRPPNDPVQPRAHAAAASMLEDPSVAWPVGCSSGFGQLFATAD